MSAYDWFAIGAVLGLLVTVGWHCSGPGPEPIPDRRPQLIADLAAYRALRKAGIEQEPGDPYSDDRIAAELVFIPHQTRRTEEDK
ncbi:hypothetical protein [Streptomyces sp. cmx-4-9]|uniref:hypothetical protein n=1 Tax=Streptomyces sp. cmx-4-9 TaxID=2790941 RepID=UPI00397FCE6C